MEYNQINISEIRNKYKPEYMKAILYLFLSISVFCFGISLSIIWYFQEFFFLNIFWIVFTVFWLTMFFVIQHDCGHDSYFPNKKSNQFLWRLLSLFTITPYTYWKNDHSKHHAFLWNLDKRENEWYNHWYLRILTLDEYSKMNFWNKFKYLIENYPLFMSTIWAPLQFFIGYHIPFLKYSSKEDNLSIILNSIFCLFLYVSLFFIMGFSLFFWILLLPMVLTAFFGFYLFSAQHRYEESWLERSNDWDFAKCAIEWSSFIDLPKILHFFTWYICYHHIHHFISKIPLYHLSKCYEENKIFQKKWLKIQDVLISPIYCLWDEKNKKMVKMKDFKYISLSLFLIFVFSCFLSGIFNENSILALCLIFIIPLIFLPFLKKRELKKFSLIVPLCWIIWLFFYSITSIFVSKNLVLLTLFFILFLFFFSLIFRIIINSLRKLIINLKSYYIYLREII